MEKLQKKNKKRGGKTHPTLFFLFLAFLGQFDIKIDFLIY